MVSDLKNMNVIIGSNQYKREASELSLEQGLVIQSEDLNALAMTRK